MKKLLPLIVAAVLTGSISNARTGTAVNNSNWNSPSTWMINGSNSVPDCGDTLTIPFGFTVTVNSQQDYSACAEGLVINVYGTLQFTNGNKLTLPFNSCVNIQGGGQLKKSTPGGGLSTAILIDGNAYWNAGMGPVTTPTSYCETLLPVSLLRFETKVQNDKINLEWTTASETNNAMFVVERSSDGESFVEISTVKGAGNTTNAVEYATTDFYPLQGVSYYRLKQIDFDGKFTYSDVAGAFMKAKSNFDFISVETTINSTIKLTFSNHSNEMCSLQVTELSGTPVFNMDMSVNSGINKKEIYCPFLKKGVYLFSISNNEQVLSKKISFID
jgi:hypothetical protein